MTLTFRYMPPRLRCLKEVSRCATVGPTPETRAAPGARGLLSSCGRSFASGRVDTVEFSLERGLSTPTPGPGSASSGPFVSAIGQPALSLYRLVSFGPCCLSASIRKTLDWRR